MVKVTKFCENHPDWVAAGVTGSGEVLCQSCLWGVYRYSIIHVPEAMVAFSRGEAVSFEEYRKECEARL